MNRHIQTQLAVAEQIPLRAIIVLPYLHERLIAKTITSHCIMLDRKSCCCDQIKTSQVLF